MTKINQRIKCEVCGSSILNNKTNTISLIKLKKKSERHFEGHHPGLEKFSYLDGFVYKHVVKNFWMGHDSFYYYW